METAALRSKYSRSNAYYRKRRTHAREKVRIKEIIAKQTIISIFIFILLFAVETIDTSVTNYISDKVRWVFQQNISINDAINKANTLIDGAIKGTIWQGELQKRKSNSQSADYDSSNNSTSSNNSNNSNNSINSVSNNSSNSVNSNDYSSSEDASNYESSTAQSDLNLIVPVEGKVSSPFGPRIDPITQVSKFHYGLDIDTEKGAMIKAAAAGEVLEITEDKIYGRNIKIKHSDGTITVYAHCSKMYQVEGSKVDQGDIIAEVGDTGYSTGTHLHFEIWRNGEALDPALYIDVQ